MANTNTANGFQLELKKKDAEGNVLETTIIHLDGTEEVHPGEI